jgi:membrane protein YdbS with pleckstrin-like domain
MKEYKPKKRVMIYWFVKYGFFFIFASFLLTASFLLNNSSYYILTKFFLNMSIIIPYLGMVYLFYKWHITNYYFLKNHLYIKEHNESARISYNEIKKIGYCNTLLEKILGITNIYIKTLSNKVYYLNGIRNNAVTNELIAKLSN